MRPQTRFDNGLVSLNPAKERKTNAHFGPADRGPKTYLLIPIGFVVGIVFLFFLNPKGESEERSEWARPWVLKRGLFDWFITEVAQQCFNSFLNISAETCCSSTVSKSSGRLGFSSVSTEVGSEIESEINPLWRWRYGRLNHHDLRRKKQPTQACWGRTDGTKRVFLKVFKMIPHGHPSVEITCKVSSQLQGLDLYQPVCQTP